MTDIREWSTTAASNNDASPDGFPEGMAPSGVNNSAREVMAAVRRWYEDSEWIDAGHTPTFVDADTFTVPTDLTAIYEVNRRLKLTDASTLYGTISASSFGGGVTTVDVTLDSGSLSGSLTQVAYSAASVTNSSITAATAGNGVLAGKDTIDSSSLLDAGVVTSSKLGSSVAHWVKVSTTTVSGAASVEITGIVTYKRHLIRIRNLDISGANAALRLTVSDDGGLSYKSSSYFRSYIGRDTGGGDQSDSGTGGTFASLTPTDIDGAVDDRYDADIELVNMPGSAIYKSIFVRSSFPILGGGLAFVDGVCGWNGGTAALNAIKIVPSAGTFPSGTLTLYGLKNE